MAGAIIVDTVLEHLKSGYTLSAWCHACKYHADISLPRLVMMGLGKTPIRDLRIECGHCGRATSLTRAPPHKNWRSPWLSD